MSVQTRARAAEMAVMCSMLCCVLWCNGGDLKVTHKRHDNSQSCTAGPGNPGRAKIRVFFTSCVATHMLSCEPWCATAPCVELTGDVRRECGACDAANACWPGASHFFVHVSADGNAEDISEHHCDFQVITATEIRAQFASTSAWAKYLQQPTLISGLIDDWPALKWLRTPQALATSAAGGIEVSAERVPARVAAGRELIALSELDVNAWARTHAVIFSDWRTDEARRADAALRPLFSTPRELNRTQTRVFSLGGEPVGARFSTPHGFAWMGLAAGAKRWYVAPPRRKMPPDPACEPRAQPDASLAGVSHCLQHAGEVIVVPESWWHATCQVAPYTIGLGGQVITQRLNPCITIRTRASRR